MRKRITTLISLAAAFCLFVQSLSAIPAFARKYGFNCNMCHVAFPKLNDLGQRFRDNGYQIPGQEGLEKTVFQTAIPLAFRTTAGYSLYGNGQDTTAGFHLYNLDLLAGGVLHKNISFLFIYTPRLDEPAADFRGPDQGGEPGQLASIESANIVFSNLVPSLLNVRIGRFEPGYQLLSSKRLYYILQPFEFYGFMGGGNGFDFSTNHIGIEATGRLRCGLKYGLGYINGSGGNPDNSAFKDVYFVLSKTHGGGEGQSAGQRFGIFGYFGWQPTDLVNAIVSPVGDADGKNNRSFYRLGADLSLNWKTFNLQAMALRGVDDKAFNTFDPTKDYAFWGGVIQLDWAGLADNRLVASLMYNWVRPPEIDKLNKLDSFSALVRYYLGSWSAVNVAAHAEYTHRSLGADKPLKDDLFTVLLDFDF